MSPDAFVDACLDALGQFEVSDSTRQSLIIHAQREGNLKLEERTTSSCSEARVAEMLQLIVATPRVPIGIASSGADSIVLIIDRNSGGLTRTR